MAKYHVKLKTLTNDGSTRPYNFDVEEESDSSAIEHAERK
jgi:hypothetical protein